MKNYKKKLKKRNHKKNLLNPPKSTMKNEYKRVSEEIPFEFPKIEIENCSPELKSTIEELKIIIQKSEDLDCKKLTIHELEKIAKNYLSTIDKFKGNEYLESEAHLYILNKFMFFK